MRRKYKIHYPQIENMGDLLNKNMLEDLFGIQVVHAPVYLSNLSAIGSGLQARLYSDQFKRYALQKATKLLREKDHHIWGTGFISYDEGESGKFLFDEICVHSLRGKLSREKMSKLLKREIDVPLGDGGLLAERWVGAVDKKFSVGIIPHYKETNSPLIEKWKAQYDNSTVISLAGDPRKVIEEIASCEYIISSSLHGLIVADSYHIPNKHVQFFPMGKRNMGDGFKYADYYSAFGLEDSSCLLFEADSHLTVNDIIDQYQVPADMVENAKDRIFDAFPRW